MRSVEQDEQFVLNAVSRFRPKQLKFNPKQTLYGGAYIYPIAAWWAALHVAHLVRLVPDAVHYYEKPEDLARLYAAGRCFSALFGLGCVVLVFWIGRELYDDETAAWAAALFGLSPIVVAYAHVLKPHLTATFYVLAALWLSLRKRFWLSAVFYGLAVGSAKYAWPVLVPLLLARPPRKQVLGLGALSVGVFFLVNPYALIEWGDFLAEMRAMTRWYASSPSLEAPFKAIWTPLRAGLGPGLWLLALAAAAKLVERRGKRDALLLSWTGSLLALTAFQVSAATGEAGTARFFLPVFALCCLLAAAGLRERAGRWALGAALVGNLLVVVPRLENFAADRPGRSYADQAADWIATHVPAGGELGIGSPAPMVDRFPPIPFSRYALVYVSGAPTAAQAGTLPERYVAAADAGLPAELRPFYALEVSFAAPRWMRDPFTQANPGIAVFRRVKMVGGA